MNCMECGKGSVEVLNQNHRYAQCGLDYVTLLSLEVRHCTHCGENEYVIPNIEQLHNLIANVVASKQERLVPAEIRFLRKYLGYSSADFAQAMGVNAATVSRWESKTDAQVMTVGLERLLRLKVMHEKPLTSYARPSSQNQIDETATKAAAPAQLRIAPKSDGWQLEEARAA
jgi:putative zinc finger/helix-turn-helix YgiT family protein